MQSISELLHKMTNDFTSDRFVGRQMASLSGRRSLLSLGGINVGEASPRIDVMMTPRMGRGGF